MGNKHGYDGLEVSTGSLLNLTEEIEFPEKLNP
jgi:hypothetical protein